MSNDGESGGGVGVVKRMRMKNSYLEKILLILINNCRNVKLLTKIKNVLYKQFLAKISKK